APPFDFDAMTEIQRSALNERIPIIAEETGCEYFDWNTILADPDNPAASLYGGHPDDDGCELIADALTDQFGKLLK
ncbi:MAG: SGNH/GDSL hydrolase family protein, partial [Oscillospiraceae bacterium]|nr:SGNH/GDSL hydrolase family protein [Oscillospiraceae bacterium]